MERGFSEHQGLHREFGVHHAARAVLDVEPAGAHRARCAHSRAHLQHLAPEGGGVARGGQHLGPHGVEAGRQRGVAGAKPGPGQGLMLPGPGGVAAAPDLVALEGGDRGHEQARVAVGSQRGVDVEQLAGGGSQRQPGDELAHKVAVDLLGAIRVGLVGVVVQEDHVQIAAVAQFFAAQLAVGNDGKAGCLAVVLAQPGPDPAQGAAERGVGQGREIVGHGLDGDQPFNVAHQGAKELGVVGVAQGVQQRVFVVFAAALPGSMAVVQAGQVLGRLEALVQQALVGQLVDHARVAHQVLHGPARQAQQAQQPAQHLGALGQQRQVTVAAQQRLDPVDETQRGGLGAALIDHAGAHACDQLAQPQLGLVAQVLHPGMAGPLAHAGGQRCGQVFEQGLAVDGRRGTAALAIAAAIAVGRRWCTLVQQHVELGGHQLSDLAQPVKQLAGLGPAGGQTQRARDPGQVGVVGGQQMGLLVVQKLNPVLDLTQEHIGRIELGGGLGLHQPARGQALQALEGGAGADLGKLAAAHHQQQLHDELDLADAAARQLDVICPLRPAGGAALGLAADFLVQLAQALEDAVVQVTSIDKGADQ